MKPLPRLLVMTDERVTSLPDAPQRAAAVAAVGPAAGLVARLPASSTDELAQLATRFVALARPPMASVFVSARSDVAAASGANGVVSRRGDLDPATMRSLLQDADVHGTAVLASVHSLEEAEIAVSQGADGLIVGTIWDTPSHPGAAVAGPGLIDRVARCGVPVWAIGGVTEARALEVRDAGAWGVAAISAVWDAPDPNRAALSLLAPWRVPEDE